MICLSELMLKRGCWRSGERLRRRLGRIRMLVNLFMNFTLRLRVNWIWRDIRRRRRKRRCKEVKGVIKNDN